MSLLLSKNNKAIPLSFNRKEIKDHGEGGNIIGDNPKGKTLIIDDVLSAGTAAKESIDLIKDVGAEPVMLLIGLDRKEKGSGDISASNELELNYGIKIKSIIDLNLLIQFSKSDPNFEKYIKDLEDYRSKWGLSLFSGIVSHTSEIQDIKKKKTIGIYALNHLINLIQN